MTLSFWLRNFVGFYDFLSLLNQIQLFIWGGVLSYSAIFIFILYTLFYFLTPIKVNSAYRFLCPVILFHPIASRFVLQ